MHNLQSWGRAIFWRSWITLTISGTANTIHNVPLELEIVFEECVCCVCSYLESQKPFADVGRSAIVVVEITYFLPELDQILIFLNDCFHRLRVVVDAPVTDQACQIAVLDLISDSQRVILRLLDILCQEDIQRRRLDCLCYIDYLFQTGNTQRYIH